MYELVNIWPHGSILKVIRLHWNGLHMQGLNNDADGCSSIVELTVSVMYIGCSWDWLIAWYISVTIVVNSIWTQTYNWTWTCTWSAPFTIQY